MPKNLTACPAFANESAEKLAVVTKMVPYPDFLGEIDESRLIGRFRDDLTDGDKLALKNFIVQEFYLEQIEAPRDPVDAQLIAERHEDKHTQIDLLCLDVALVRESQSALSARLFKLLSLRAIVCIESGDKTERMDARLLPESTFELVMAAPGFSVFSQIKSKRPPYSVRYHIDLFRRKRYVMRKRRAKLAAEPKIPEVAVFVLTYKHEAFIAECLRSVMNQRGHFTMRVLIIDDASPDKTAPVARSVIAENRDHRITFELRVNPRNIGASANWGPALRWAEGADYVALCDGDDFWSSRNRIQEHIDLMQKHPNVLMSFNSFEFCTANSSERRRGIHLDEEIVSASRIVERNPVGHLGSTFYRGELAEVFPLEPFYYVNGDWKINVYCSQIGRIGYLDNSSSVYRLHGGGVWSLRTGLDRIIPTIESISKYNAFTDFSYNNEFDWLINDRYRALSQFVYGSIDDFGKVDLIILCKGVPREDHFSHAELTSYLHEFSSALMLTAIGNHHQPRNPHFENRPYQRRYPEIENRLYQRRYPEVGSRVIGDDGTFPLHIGKLIYAATLKDIIAGLSRIEEAGAPFVFTLCPKGGFAFSHLDVDRQLKRIFGSPCFQKVIVTQPSIYDYVIRNKFCPAEKVELNYGGSIAKIPNAQSIHKSRWGSGKAGLDICFMAHDDAPRDRSMAYDLFRDVINVLQQRFNDIRFHVIGALSPSQDFDGFVQDMDIIVSPTLGSKTPPRVIDSFLSDRCVEAGVRGGAIFAADDFNDASGHFIDGQNIVIVKRDVADIVARIERYYADPEALKVIGENGAQSIRALYCPELQIEPRINLLREVIRNSAPVGEVLALKVKIAAMQSELAQSPQMQVSFLLRGLGRLLVGCLDRPPRQIFRFLRSSGFTGLLRRAFVEGTREQAPPKINA